MYQKRWKTEWGLVLILLFLLSTGFSLHQAWATAGGNTIYLPMVQQPFPFAKTETSPLYLQNFANQAGCEWMGVAGEVLNASGQPILDEEFMVHVWGSGIDTRVTSGSHPEYSPSGWVVFLFDTPVQNSYHIQLETSDLVPVSAVYPFESRNSCNENLILFTFIENNP